LKLGFAIRWAAPLTLANLAERASSHFPVSPPPPGERESPAGGRGAPEARGEEVLFYNLYCPRGRRLALFKFHQPPAGYSGAWRGARGTEHGTKLSAVISQLPLSLDGQIWFYDKRKVMRKVKSSEFSSLPSEFRTMVTDPTKDYGYVQRLARAHGVPQKIDEVVLTGTALSSIFF
jgi:hypothetical protein